MNEQTLEKGHVIIVARIEKKDCLTVDAAQESLGCSRASLYTYLNVLNIQRIKFPFDKHSYIATSDVEQVRKFMQDKQ